LRAKVGGKKKVLLQLAFYPPPRVSPLTFSLGRKERRILRNKFGTRFECKLPLEATLRSAPSSSSDDAGRDEIASLSKEIRLLPLCAK